MKIHEKMNLFNSNFETKQEKFLKVKFITDKINYLLTHHVLHLENTDIFIGYILELNNFKIFTNDKIYLSSDIQTITHYIEKEYYSQK